MLGSPVGGFSIIVYTIILLVRAILYPFARHRFIHRLFYSLIGKEHDGPLRCTFAYVLSGTILVYMGGVMFNIVTMGFLAAPSFTLAAERWNDLSSYVSSMEMTWEGEAR